MLSAINWDPDAAQTAIALMGDRAGQAIAMFNLGALLRGMAG